jgi:hypothetical protein
VTVLGEDEEEVGSLAPNSISAAPSLIRVTMTESL